MLNKDTESPTDKKKKSTYFTLKLPLWKLCSYVKQNESREKYTAANLVTLFLSSILFVVLNILSPKSIYYLN